MPAPYALDALFELMERDGERFLARYSDFALYSHFQPIFSLAHRRVVGHEGLMRAWDARGRALSPYAVFSAARSEQEVVTLDRLSRLLHASNFACHVDPPGQAPHWLFLNAEPNAFAHAGKYGRFFPQMLAQLGVAPERVVIEVLETAIENNRLMANAVDYFREIGCLIAIDDFGAGHSNVDRIWRLRPDIVKLDRSLITDAVDNREARHIMPGLVNLLHEAGALVLAEGIETTQEARLALEADCDLVQGYYFALPGPALVVDDDRAELFDQLWIEFNTTAQQDIEHNQQYLAPYVNALLQCAARLSEGDSVANAGREFIALPDATRCFLLDTQGRQIIGQNLLNPNIEIQRPLRFAPLDNVEGAVWARRPYFRQALKRFGELQVSRPYLSISGEASCITLSLGLLRNGEAQVLCGDLVWQGPPEIDGADAAMV